MRVLDLGCGEGKNAAALARAGANVVAVDCSNIAIANGKKAFVNLPIDWQVREAIAFPEASNGYDLVVMYGLAHCLPSQSHISELIDRAISATQSGGYHLFVAFNDRSQDLKRAHPGFNPTLVSHSFYLKAYAGHDILKASDSILEEIHPHNGISHHHSLTRMKVQMR